MNMSEKTRKAQGLPPHEDSLRQAVGVTGSRVTKIASMYDDITDPIIKAEQILLRSQAVEMEDDPFLQLNITALGEKGQIIEPTYNFTLLAALPHQNNVLLQAITSMEVNIDGTGYEIERRDGAAFSDADEKKTKKLFDFFDEPFPGVSFTTMRRTLRRDLEDTGNAYLEVIRNQKGELVFLRNIEAKLVRLLRLDKAKAEVRKIKRGGEEINAKVLERQRRYVQIVGEKQVRFFKDFGVERNLNADTGVWEGDDNGAEITAESKANELIHFTVLRDVLTPYGVPRWVNNFPSVLGSRKAEEFNLEFFDHGGLPPAIILIQGGQLSEESKTTLANYLSSKAKRKQRGIIAEIFAATGDLGSAGNVKVTVERFGDERQKDSMFGLYDDRCAEHVRIAFRLPPMFLGLSEAYNFATAYTAYMIAEAQVFLPERDEFDEVVNLKIMKEFKDAKDYVYRSKGLNVVDVEQKMKAIEISKDYMDPTDFIDEINEIARTAFRAKEGIDDEEFENAVTEGVNRFVGAAERRVTDREELESGKPNVINTKGDGQGRILKIDDDVIRNLADDWAGHLSGDLEFEPASIEVMDRLIGQLAPPMRKLFTGYVGLRLSQGGFDDAGVAKLLACVGHRHDGDDGEPEVTGSD